MSTSRLPEEVKEILTDHIDSVSQLEALMLFFKDPERSWNPESLSRELRSNSTSASRQMSRLASSGFIRHTNGDNYHYSPSSEKLRRSVEKLHDEYAEKQVAVITYIYEKPNDKLKVFADAFKLKKD